MSTLDIGSNRIAKKYTYKELFYRILWGLGRQVFRFSPRPCFAMRRSILRLFGAKIGPNALVMSSVKIQCPWNLEIHEWGILGDSVRIVNQDMVVVKKRATIAQRTVVYSSASDSTNVGQSGSSRPVVFGEESWVGAEAIISSGVHIGNGAIVGARTNVAEDVAEMDVVVGDPQRKIKRRQRNPDYDCLLDPYLNHQSFRYSNLEKLARVAWMIGIWIFHCCPFNVFRCFILSVFGAKIESNVKIHSSVKIMFPWKLKLGRNSIIEKGVNIYNLGDIKIGSNTRIYRFAHLCAGTHDFSTPALQLLRLPITIGDCVEIGVNSFIGPNVVVDDNCIIMDFSVVFKSVNNGATVVGNPARNTNIQGSNKLIPTSLTHN